MEPTANSFLCEKHFQEEHINRRKRCTLKWKVNPIHTEIARKRLSPLTNIVSLRRPSKIHNIEPDQLFQFNTSNIIRRFSNIDPIIHYPPGFAIRISSTYLLIYRSVFDKEIGYPSLNGCLRIDEDFHAKLQNAGKSIPLPYSSHNAKLTRYSMH